MTLGGWASVQGCGRKVGGGLRLKGLHEQCLCEDKGRTLLVSARPRLLRRLSFSAWLSWGPQDPLHMGSQEGGVIHTLTRAPPAGARLGQQMPSLPFLDGLFSVLYS